MGRSLLALTMLACACAGPIVLKTGVACLLIGIAIGAVAVLKVLS